MTSDSNNENYLNNMEMPKIFKDDINNNECNNNLPLEILNEIKNSGINFIITYVPRPYDNIKSSYSNDNEIEILKKIQKI